MTRAAHLIFGLLVALLLASPASAATVSNYRVEIDLRGGGYVASYAIRLDYEPDVGEAKTDGYKFLGEHELRNLRLIDSPGATVSKEHGFEESRVSFSLARDAAGKPQPIEFAFDQKLPDARYRWDGLEYSMPWLNKFRIPVRAMEVIVLVPPDWKLDGYDCVAEGDSNC